MSLFHSLPLFLAQTTDDTLNAYAAQQQHISPVAVIIELVILVAMIAALWKVFTKAGEPGWAAIVPIYNAYILCKIAGKPGWWVILFLIPFVNFVIAILVNLGLAKAFGKGGGFAVGLILLPFIFLPILGFGDARYLGSTAGSLATGTSPYPTV